jgi:hypothetical protein
MNERKKMHPALNMVIWASALFVVACLGMIVVGVVANLVTEGF